MIKDLLNIKILVNFIDWNIIHYFFNSIKTKKRTN